MNIKIEYLPTAKELAKASSLFAEKKPFLLFIVGFINIVLGFFLVIFMLKFIKMGLTTQDLIALFICVLWVFGRRPFNEWILYQRMKHSPVLTKPLTVEISRNGIVWSGKGLRQGNMAWDQIKYILEAKNGFLFPNTLNRFLWIPFRGFSKAEDIQELKAFIQEKNIVHRIFPKWEC